MPRDLDRTTHGRAVKKTKTVVFTTRNRAREKYRRACSRRPSGATARTASQAELTFRNKNAVFVRTGAGVVAADADCAEAVALVEQPLVSTGVDARTVPCRRSMRNAVPTDATTTSPRRQRADRSGRRARDRRARPRDARAGARDYRSCGSSCARAVPYTCASCAACDACVAAGPSRWGNTRVSERDARGSCSSWAPKRTVYVAARSPVLPQPSTGL